MPSAFLSQDLVRVALPDDPDNAIYILPRMNIGQKNQVQGASVGMDAKGKTTLDIGAGQNALMAVNFRKWEGPLFTMDNGKLAPCTPDYQQRLDPDLPLVQLALKEVNDRNREVPSPDPNEAAPNTSSTAGATS